MKKHVRNVILYSTALSLLFMGGVKLKNWSEQSTAFAEQVVEFSDNFLEDDFLIVAHRGFSSLAPENTTDAIILATDADYVDCVEIDARLTNDQQLVLSHNSSLLTSDMQSVTIEEEDYDTLRSNQYYPSTASTLTSLGDLLHNDYAIFYFQRSKCLGSQCYDIPSLEEGMNACRGKTIFLDLKFDGNTDDFINALVKELSTRPKEDIVIQSADLPSLRRLQERLPDFCYSAIIKKKSDLEFIPQFDFITIRKNLVTEELVDELICQNKQVAVWTVNTPEEINSTIEKLGNHYKDVFYISDYPDVVGSCLSQKQKCLLNE